MIRIRSNLSMKLSVGILLLAIPLFMLSLGIFYMQSKKLIRNEAARHVNSVLNTTAHRVKTKMGTVETAAKANQWVMENESLSNDMLHHYSQRIVSLNRNVSSCHITSATDTVGMLMQQRRYTAVLEHGKAQWVSPSVNDYDEASHEDSLTAFYCMPIHGADGSFAGILSAGMSMDSISTVLDTMLVSYKNAYFVLLGSRGEYLVHPDTTKIYAKTIFTDIDPVKHPDLIALGYEMTSGARGMMNVNVRGEDCIVCYRPIDGTDWSIALVCPDDDILRLHYWLTNIVIMLLAIGFVVIMILSRHTVLQAIRPLGLLLEKLERIAGGNYETHIPKTERKDVIGRLQNSFAVMLQSLNFHMGSIRYTADQTKSRNEELVVATQKAEEAAKRKTIFMQNVTHQIRTPLNIILGFAQVLRDSISHAVLSEEEATSITKTMKHNAMALERLVLMLFDSSETGANEEIQSSHNERIVCNAVAQECIGYMHIHFPDIEISVKTSVPDDVTITTNHLFLMRSLRELLYNAAKYSDGQNISLEIVETDTTLRFIVQDTGPGISESSAEQIFQPFIKVNDLSEGLGLGLALSKRHAISLGGNLTLDSSYHDGCRFILEVPKKS